MAKLTTYSAEKDLEIGVKNNYVSRVDYKMNNF